MIMRPQAPPHFEETVKRLTSDMKEAERYLVYADLQQGTLEGLSEAVDKVRATTWAVLNSAVDQFSGPPGMIVLTTHRVQRALALMSALNEELDAGHVKPTTQGVADLHTTLGVVYKKLYYLLTGKPAPEPEKS